MAVKFLAETNPLHTAFYVSVIDTERDRATRICGPFPSHEDAKAAVSAVREKAYSLDPRSHWYAFGTCSLPAHDGRAMPITLN